MLDHLLDCCVPIYVTIILSLCVQFNCPDQYKFLRTKWSPLIIHQPNRSPHLHSAAVVMATSPIGPLNAPQRGVTSTILWILWILISCNCNSDPTNDRLHLVINLRSIPLFKNYYYYYLSLFFIISWFYCRFYWADFVVAVGNDTPHYAIHRCQSSINEINECKSASAIHYSSAALFADWRWSNWMQLDRNRIHVEICIRAVW